MHSSGKAGVECRQSRFTRSSGTPRQAINDSGQIATDLAILTTLAFGKSVAGSGYWNARRSDQLGLRNQQQWNGREKSQITGDAIEHAFLWQSGVGMKDLGTLGSPGETAAKVVGSSRIHRFR